MAILRGFPPSNTISPSVRITEKDNSLIQQEQSFHRAGLVGFASKGPINVPTLVSTHRQLATVFGNPHPEASDPYLIYAAQQYLFVANELWIVRVGDEDNVSDQRATHATVTVPSSGGKVSVESATVGPYTIVNDQFFRWSVNGIVHSKALVVFPGTYSASQLADVLNDQLTPDIDGIQFYATSGDTLGVETTYAYGPDAELEFLSIQDMLVGGPVGGSDDTNVVGLGTGMTRATITASNADFGGSASVPGTYDFSGLVGDVNLQIVIDGTDNVLIDNVVQIIDLTGATVDGGANLSGSVDIADLVVAINDLKVENGGTLTGGWTAYAAGDNLAFRTDHWGRDARLLIKSDSTAGLLFGFDPQTKTGQSPAGVSGTGGVATYGRINGDANVSGAVAFAITADSAGIDGNATQVVIKNNLREGTFQIQVFNNGQQVESFGPLSKDESSRFYVETFISMLSDWIRVVDNPSNPAPPLDGTYRLSGGSDGIPADPDDQDSLIIGNSFGFTGLYALSEPEQIDIDLIAAPGHSSTAVVAALLDLSQNIRSDCMAIIDPPFGLSVNEIVAWQNGTHPLNGFRFDSDFGALFWPWLKIRDNFNRIDVWAPPSGSVMATIARSDQLSAPWFAPAGLTRGVVQNVLDVFSRPTLEERDLMYGSRNCINPIVQFADSNGFVLWGQKTLQRLPSALDRINVRRLMLYVEKRIRTTSRQLLFDPHDAELREKFIRISTAVLSEVQVGRGITAFRVECDERLNTPDVIDRNELRALIGIQPVRAAEFVFIEFSLHRTGTFDAGTDSF